MQEFAGAAHIAGGLKFVYSKKIDTQLRGNALEKIDKLVDAALSHVPFDGWSQTVFEAATRDSGISPEEAIAIAPRGHVDLACRYHVRNDQSLNAEGMADLRYSQKVGELVWRRIQLADKEVVRKGMALFGLPRNALEGTSLIWGMADAIWTALGDTSDDINWYSKRTILSGVYGSAVLFWLGDTSEGDVDTRAFIDRRIENVMQFEKFKSSVSEHPALRPFAQLHDTLFSGLKAPTKGPRPGC